MKGFTDDETEAQSNSLLSWPHTTGKWWNWNLNPSDSVPLAHRGRSQPRQISETLCSWKALIRPAGMSHWGRAPTHSWPLLLLGSSDYWARASTLTLPQSVQAVGHSSALPKAPCGHQIPREIDVRNCMSMYIYITAYLWSNLCLL